MSDPFIGQINMFGFNFAPQNWALCDGQLMAISQNQALFSLLGTFYGGDGRTSFGLPDLRGRVPMGMGSGPGLTTRPIGEKAGLESTSQIPAHSHTLAASTATTGLTQVPAANWTLGAATSNSGGKSATTNPVDMYGTAEGAVPSAPTSTTGSPGSVSLINPMQVLNFSIALLGLFPSRN